MRYVIMANGKGKRWNRYAGITKHHIPIANETILERTVRLVKQEDPAAEIIISSADPSNEVAGATRHTPLKGEREIDRFCVELIVDDTCFLYGDTFYTPEAIATIAETPADPLLFFGQEHCIAGVKVADASVMLAHLRHLNALIDAGEIPDAKGWTLYHLSQGMPLQGKSVAGGFVFLDDAVMDINSPADYQSFLQTHPSYGIASLPDGQEPSATPFSFKALPANKRLRYRLQAFLLRAEGFTAAAARSWVRILAHDRENAAASSLSNRQQRRAHKEGFSAAAGRSAGLFTQTDPTALPLSQRDYLYLQPLNEVYGKWLADRITTLRVFSDFQSLFETHHLHIVSRDGEPFLIPLSDQARQQEHTVQGLHALLRQTGTVALAPTSWTKNGHWTLHATGTGGFLLDGELMSAEDLWAWLRDTCRKKPLAIFEFKRDGGFLGALAPGGMATLRVTMLNDGGHRPHIAQALVEVGYPVPQLQAKLLQASGQERELLMAKAANQGADDISHRTHPRGSGASMVPSLIRRYYSEVSPSNGSFQSLRTPDESVAGGMLRFSVAPDASQPFAGTVPHWHDIATALVAMCRKVPQIEIAEFELDVSPKGFHIIAVHSNPRYNTVMPFCPELQSYLTRRLRTKISAQRNAKAMATKFLHVGKLAIRKRFGRLVAPKGLVPYQSIRWPRDVMRDLTSGDGVSLRKKLWAYRHGFLSFRLNQYGIAPDNWESYISDFEYRWLRHINNGYRTWLEDKVTLKLVDSAHREAYPAYYYLTSTRGGTMRAVALADLPAGYGSSGKEILRLAKEKGVLACKPHEGSHGEGFFALSWNQGSFWLNGEPADEKQVLAVFGDPDTPYLVSEYVQTHPELAALYPGSTNTIRITVYKPDGREPRIGNAYLRIGSSQSGAVDNVAAGGVVARVNCDTGWYGDAKRLDGIDQGNLIDCPHHPDTGVLIEGFIPRWEQARQTVLSIARALPQLEYLGFDVAITQEGVKVIEVNRFPDFPRVDVLDPQLITYLLGRLDAKKKDRGYDQAPCRKLLSLPKRTKSLGGNGNPTSEL